MSSYAARRRAALGDHRAILITDETNVRYLTGFTGDATVLLMWREGRRRRELAISDGRFEVQLAEQCPEIEAFIRKPSVKLADAVRGQAKKTKAGPFLVEPHAMRVAAFAALNADPPEDDDDSGTDEESPPQPLEGDGLFAVAAEPLVDRSVKDAGEIAAIRHAVATAERVFDYMRHRVRPHTPEWELDADGEHVARQFGMRGWSFPAIVAAGDRAALPHYEPGDRTLEPESHLLIDWGVRSRDGYVSDMTRVLLRKKSPAKLRKIYDAVLDAHRQSAAALRPGAIAHEVDGVARRILEDAGYGKLFNHSLGHGIGLQVHEGPGLRTGETTELQAGMVVTIEPGVYAAGFGGVRLENDYLITEDGAECLGALPLDADAMTLDW